MKKLIFMLIGSVVLNAAAQNYTELPQIKLIHDGWGFQYSAASTAFLRNHIESLEKSIPGQGIVIQFKIPAEKCAGKTVNTNAIFENRKIEYEYFKDDIENLKNTPFRKFTDNFLGLTLNPGNIDWFSDEDWAVICHNYSVASRVAKAAGLTGVKLDIEEYHANTMWQFKSEKGYTLEETRKKIRQRGQEFGRALFTPFPDMQVLCYWWFSLARHKNDLLMPERENYMVAPFINGMYDVMPPGIRIHEGNETCSYRANCKAEFYHLAVDMTKAFPRFVAPENLVKYRNQTRLAPGIYIDPHFSERKNYWKNQLQPDLNVHGGSRLLKRNLQQAMEVADCYVWMWHERFCWFPSDHPAKLQLLEKVSPGLKDELDLILRSMPAAKEAVTQKKLKNLVHNGDFSKMPEGKQAIANFAQWFNGNGQFQRKVISGNPVAAAVGVVEGCIFQSHRVKSGQIYLVRCSMQNPGSRPAGCGTLSVNWKKADGERFADYVMRRYRFNDQKGITDTAEFTVYVPEGAEYLELMLSASGMKPGEEIYFDNLELYLIQD